MKNKIVIVGGHLTPALAVKEELQSRGYSDLIWVGTKYSQTNNSNFSAEYELLKEDKNVKFVELKAGKIWRKLTFKTLIPAIKNTLLLPYGFIRGFYVLNKFSPELVISFGGHLGLVMVICAKKMGIKTVTHEQTTTKGTSNQKIAKYADLVLLSWQNTLKYFPAEKSKVVGLPIRKSIFEKHDLKVFDNDDPIIMVAGGNQGSNTINWRLLEILEGILPYANIIHLTGNSTITNDYQKAINKRDSLPLNIISKYKVFDSLFGKEQTYSAYLQKSSIVLARSGANTIAELLALGKLSILIPIPWSSNNEQHENAKLIESTGLGLIVHQTSELKPEDILEAIQKALISYKGKRAFNGVDLQNAQRKAQILVNPDASRLFVNEIEQLL